jgi:multiple antibiotic resistance protein
MGQMFAHRIVIHDVVSSGRAALDLLQTSSSVFDVVIMDFQIAGGLILLALASRELITLDKQTPISVDDFGVVPLGMPLLAGPATITTLLFLADTVGFKASLTALIANLVLTNLLFRGAEHVTRILGKTMLRALSKIIALLLVAIAVHIIRLGLKGI